MRFQSIKIQNYRSIRDFELNFIKKENDLHIFLIPNAGGKTNLLNAITWCLYETEYEPNSVVPFIPNDQVIEEAKEKGETTCMVSVEIKIEKSGVVTEFIRCALFDVNTKEKVQSQFDIINLKANGEKLSRDQFEMESLASIQLLLSNINKYCFLDVMHTNNSFYDKTNLEESINLIKQNKEEVKYLIESKSTDIFRLLLGWKKRSLNYRIEITRNYDIKLIDQNGLYYEESMEEKYIARISYFLAIQELLKYDLPIFIVEPFDMISIETVKGFANKIIELSKESQVIMLSHPRSLSDCDELLGFDLIRDLEKRSL